MRRASLWLCLLLFATSPFLAASGQAAGKIREFTVVSVEYEGTKFWIPSTLIVDKGDTVRIKLINKVASGGSSHGYAIPAYDIATVVTRGEPKQVEFRADKAGIFTIKCHLHPAHIGGQLLVR